MLWMYVPENLSNVIEPTAKVACSTATVSRATAMCPTSPGRPGGSSTAERLATLYVQFALDLVRFRR